MAGGGCLFQTKTLESRRDGPSGSVEQLLPQFTGVCPPGLGSKASAWLMFYTLTSFYKALVHGQLTLPHTVVVKVQKQTYLDHRTRAPCGGAAQIYHFRFFFQELSHSRVFVSPKLQPNSLREQTNGYDEETSKAGLAFIQKILLPLSKVLFLSTASLHFSSHLGGRCPHQLYMRDEETEAAQQGEVTCPGSQPSQ